MPSTVCFTYTSQLRLQCQGYCFGKGQRIGFNTRYIRMSREWPLKLRVAEGVAALSGSMNSSWKHLEHLLTGSFWFLPTLIVMQFFLVLSHIEAPGLRFITSTSTSFKSFSFSKWQPCVQLKAMMAYSFSTPQFLFLWNQRLPVFLQAVLHSEVTLSKWWGPVHFALKIY
jgi:hypothetical protein